MLTATLPFHALPDIYQHLIDGNEQACRDLLYHLHENEEVSVLTLCEAMTQAFHKIGEAWKCSQIEIYREHIASQIGHRLILDLQSLLSSPKKDAPVAIGCTPELDPYILATGMVELVLRELGFRAQSLGTNLPLEMLVPALDDIKPQLCWVSVSQVDSTERLWKQLSRLGAAGESRGIEIICGGRCINDEIKIGLSNIKFLQELRDLEAHVATNL